MYIHLRKFILSSYILFPGLKFFSGPKYRRLIFSEGVSAAITFEFAI